MFFLYVGIENLSCKMFKTFMRNIIVKPCIFIYLYINIYVVLIGNDFNQIFNRKWKENCKILCESIQII